MLAVSLLSAASSHYSVTLPTLHLQCNNIARRVKRIQWNRHAGKGDQQKAKKAFETAMKYSQTNADLNEDARAQLRNVQRQNALVGLVKRRDDIISNHPTIDKDKKVVIDDAKFNKGNFTASYAKEVEQSLSLEESKNLTAIADRIMNQQVAAAQKIQPLLVSFPQQGKLIHFKRNLQITPEAEMKVHFKADKIETMIPKGTERKDATILFSLLTLLSAGLLGWRPRAKKE